jgi:hypothetical protein
MFVVDDAILITLTWVGVFVIGGLGYVGCCATSDPAHECLGWRKSPRVLKVDGTDLTYDERVRLLRGVARTGASKSD